MQGPLVLTHALLLPLLRAQYDFNAQPYEQRCLGSVDFLVDIELLAHVDYAVLTFNSGLAHLVDTLRCAALPCAFSCQDLGLINGLID